MSEAEAVYRPHHPEATVSDAAWLTKRRPNTRPCVMLFARGLESMSATAKYLDELVRDCKLSEEEVLYRNMLEYGQPFGKEEDHDQYEDRDRSQGNQEEAGTDCPFLSLAYVQHPFLSLRGHR